MNNITKIGLVFSCLFFTMSVFSQEDWSFSTHANNAVSIDVDSTHLYVATRNGLLKINKATHAKEKIHFEEPDGISADYLTTVRVVDSQGLWVGHYYFGASLGDTTGMNWENYQRTTGPLTSNFVRAIEQAPSGAIYFGTYYGYVCIYDQGQWSYLNMDNTPFPNYNLITIAFDNDSTDTHAWFGTKRGGIVHRQDSVWTIYNVENSPLPENTINAIGIDQQGRKWIATQDGLAMLDSLNEEWVVYKQNNSDIPRNLIQDLVIGLDSSVWIATNYGVARYKDEAWQNYLPENSGLIQQEISCLAIDKWTGKVWVGTYSQGIMSFDGSNWEHIPLDDTLSLGNDVLCLDFTKDSTLLVGTRHEGLFIQKDSVWTRLTEDQTNLTSNQIAHVQQDSFGKVWVGYKSSGLDIIDGDSVLHFDSHNSPLAYPFEVMNDLYVDGRHQAWIAMYGGIMRYNYQDSAWTIIENKSGGINRPVTAIEPDTSGFLWIGGDGSALKLLDSTGAIIGVFDTPDHFIKNSLVTDIEIDAYGHVWVGTFGNGIMKMVDTLNHWIHYNTVNSPLGSNVISSLQMGFDSTMWIGTTGTGLYSFHEPMVWHNYTVYSGDLPQGLISDMVADPTGKLWLATLHMGLGVHLIPEPYIPPPEPVDTTIVFSPEHVSFPFRIYPNPVKDNLHLECSTPTNTTLQVTILQSDGRVVAPFHKSYFPIGKENFLLPVDHLVPGQYFLHIRTDDGKIGVKSFTIVP